MVTIMQKHPGAQYFVLLGLQDFFLSVNNDYQATVTYVVQTQKEKEVLDGYCLVYGRSLQIEVGEHKLVVSEQSYLFLWVVEVSALS